MSEIVELGFSPEDVAIRKAKLMQRTAFNGTDGLEDFVLTGGAWIDATSDGISAKDVASVFFESEDALDFEARLWVKRGFPGRRAANLASIDGEQVDNLIIDVLEKMRSALQWIAEASQEPEITQKAEEALAVPSCHLQSPLE